jgi:hypothetical protein
MSVSYIEIKEEAYLSGIHFDTIQYVHSSPGNVPEEHREKFLCIQKLGEQKAEEYCSQPTMNNISGPWQRERKKSANDILQRAKKCREENRNEAGWRDEIETSVFQRFYIEVTWYSARFTCRVYAHD